MQSNSHSWVRLEVLIFKVRSHQTRMKRYARMIYMLRQCKDAIDNPAAALTNQERALAVT